MKNNGVKMETIAELAGVSVMTVSRALSGANNCNPATRKKIENIAKQLGYFPNLLGRSLLQNKLNTVGIIIPNIIHSFFPRVVNAIEEKLANHGINTFLCCSRDDTKIESEKVRMLLGYRVAGIIMFPSLRSKESEISARTIIDNGCPLVIVDRLIPKISADSVGWKSEQGMDEMVAHLLSRGCKNLVYCAGDIDEWKNRKRTLGFFSALKRRDVKPAGEIYCEPSAIAVEKEIKNLLSRNNNIDAICCATDICADLVLYALKRMKIKVPEDIAITGFGAVINNHNSKLTITTARQDEALMGKTSAEIIIERILSKNKPPFKPLKKILLPVKVEYGQSSMH